MRFQFLAPLALLVGAIRVSAQHGFTDDPSEAPFWWYPDKSNLEGPAFYTFFQTSGSPPGLIRFYELYNSITKEYFYTAWAAEREALHPPSGVIINYKGWLDGTFDDLYVFGAPQANTVPLYRSYNGHDHLYSMDESEGPRIGYHLEGVAGHVYPTAINGAQPVYRWYRP